MPNAKLRKSSSLKPDTDLGRLNLRSYVDSKRKQTQKERKEYEKNTNISFLLDIKHRKQSDKNHPI